MILIETAKSNERSLDAKVLLAKQLRDRGHKAVIDGALWPEEAPRGLQYDAAATISEIEIEELSQIVLLGTEEADEATMIRLRSLSSESTQTSPP